MSACERYEADLSALLDGELDDARKEELYAHMAVCPECKALYETFSLLHEDAMEPPADLTERIMDAVRAEAKADNVTPMPKRRNRWIPWLAAAACFVVIVGVVAIPRLAASTNHAPAKIASRALPMPTPGNDAPAPSDTTGLTDASQGADQTQEGGLVSVNSPMALSDAAQIDAVEALLTDPEPAEAPDSETPPLLVLDENGAETTIYLDGDDVLYTTDGADYFRCADAADALITFLSGL